MNRALLLKAMTLKEARSLFRERHQVLGLIFAVGFLVANLLFVSVGLRRDIQGRLALAAMVPPVAATQPTTTQPTTSPAATTAPARPRELIPAVWPPQAISFLRWAILGAAGLFAFVISSMIATSMSLASFVGERDGATLELLLVSPLSDAALFVFRCLAVFIPAVVVVYLFQFAAGAVLWLSFHDVLPGLPVAVVVQASLLSLPLPLLVTLAQIGLGACVSLRAQSLKGAGQLFGVVLLLISACFFVAGVIIRLLNLTDTVKRLALWWFDGPFALQYLSLVVGLSMAVAVLFLAGWLLFDRERLLT